MQPCVTSGTCLLAKWVANVDRKVAKMYMKEFYACTEKLIDIVHLLQPKGLSMNMRTFVFDANMCQSKLPTF